MRVVVQRVSYAKCIVNDEIVSEINKGFMLLVGFQNGDTLENVEKLAKKISTLRVFDDGFGKMNLSIRDISGSILSISQFTLYADTSKSNRPSFTSSMKKEEAIKLYDYFNKQLNDLYLIPTKAGIFGAHMYLDICCDGPVTINLEA